MTTSQDALVRIALITTLTAQDLDDMQACNAVQLAALMRGYENDGKVGDRASGRRWRPSSRTSPSTRRSRARHQIAAAVAVL